MDQPFQHNTLPLATISHGRGGSFEALKIILLLQAAPSQYGLLACGCLKKL